MERKFEPDYDMKNSMLVDGIVFSSSRYVLLALSTVRNIFVARVLGPEEYGLWIIITLILSYGDQIHLGLRHAGDKEIPYYQGQKKAADSIAIANTIYSGILVLSFFAFIVLIIYSVLSPNLPTGFRSGMQMAALIIVFDQINRFYLMILRTHKRFIFSSKVESLFELLRTIFVCGFVLLFQFTGVVFAFLLTTVINAVYFVSHYKKSFFPKLYKRFLKPLFHVGTPLFLSGLLYLLLISLDRLVGATVLSKEALGIYGLAALIAQIPITSSHGIALVLYPNFSEQFGATADIRSMYPLFVKIVLTVAYIAPIIVVSILYVAEIFIPFILSDYTESVTIIYILMNGIFFLCISPILLITMMAGGKHKRYILIQFSSVAIAVILYFSFVLSRPEGSAIATVAAISFFIYTSLMFIAVMGMFGTTKSTTLKMLSEIYMPCIYSIVIIYALHQINLFDINSVFITTVIKFFIFILLYIPMLFVVNKKTGIFTKIRSLRRSRNS